MLKQPCQVFDLSYRNSYCFMGLLPECSASRVLCCTGWAGRASLLNQKSIHMELVMWWKMPKCITLQILHYGQNLFEVITALGKEPCRKKSLLIKNLPIIINSVKWIKIVAILLPLVFISTSNCSELNVIQCNRFVEKYVEARFSNEPMLPG